MKYVNGNDLFQMIHIPITDEDKTIGSIMEFKWLGGIVSCHSNKIINMSDTF